jgi:YHS domain-containing protein
MLYREIISGFLLAGFIGVIHPSVFNTLFLHNSPDWIRIPENALIGPIIAVLSFVCSVGNIPLAAVLWSGGISFAGVMAFIFADLIVLPIIAIYRKYYGTGFALRMTALMFTTMVIAALIVDGLFSSAGLIPKSRPTAADIFTSIQFDYKLILNALAVVIFAALFGLTIRRGVKDPICGMTVDRVKAFQVSDANGQHYFCSEGCRERYASTPPEKFEHDASSRPA